MAEVNLRGVNKSFGSVSVIHNLNLEIAHGELIVFVGPSGCGKSTLLRMIAGLEDISAGELFIDGIECSATAPKDRGIAMVFQSYALYPHMSVYDNVGFALKLAKIPKLDRDAKIHETARVLQMEHLLDRKPAQLSGGQRQRVAIGRAIVRQPKVFLFDEPLSNLDAALRGDMRIEIAKLHQELGATMIYVTHDQVEAMTLADRIVVLNEGVVQQVGAPLDLYERPANLFVAGFIGAPKMNLLAVNRQSATDTTLGVGSDIVRTTVFHIERMDRQLTEACVLGIRPQQLRLSEMDKAQLTGVVAIVEHLGSETILNVELDQGGTSLLATLAGNVRIKPGEHLGLSFEPEDAHLFLKSGPRLPTAQRPLA